MKKGAIVTELCETGKVVGYYCLVDTHNSPGQPRLATFSAMIEKIESLTHSPHFTETSSVQILANRLVQHVKVVPPMAIQDFIAQGKECGAVTNVYALALNDKSRNLEQGCQQAA